MLALGWRACQFVLLWSTTSLGSLNASPHTLEMLHRDLQVIPPGLLNLPEAFEDAPAWYNMRLLGQYDVYL